jgi:polyisoprenoid-binding protein YceI
MAATAQQGIEQGTWQVDPAHSSVEFQVKHMGIATVKGFFGEFTGQLEVTGDDATAYGTVSVASVNTRDAQRDEHLRSADFFDVENHPGIEFRSTAIEPTDDETLRVQGELTIRGTTRPIELEAELQGADVDPWGNERVALEATGRIDRSDYGMTFNQALGSGNMLVADRVELVISVSAVKAS